MDIAWDAGEIERQALAWLRHERVLRVRNREYFIDAGDDAARKAISHRRDAILVGIRSRVGSEQLQRAGCRLAPFGL
ncbi:MAG: hypothetical protein K2X84_01530, partial [Beijerinckiaceae bacterium]|nr:hypothetical protein [Beijerinckiaceae bacterium]